MAGSYRDLLVWQKGIDLSKAVYAATGERTFPKEERYGLTAQIRRAAISVPSNIAEGQARRSTKEFVQFLYVAKGSLAELDTQARIARALGYVTASTYEEILGRIEELQRMIFFLIKNLRARRDSQ